jgi:hypothetical protein
MKEDFICEIIHTQRAPVTTLSVFSVRNLWPLQLTVSKLVIVASCNREFLKLNSVCSDQRSDVHHTSSGGRYFGGGGKSGVVFITCSTILGLS